MNINEKSKVYGHIFLILRYYLSLILIIFKRTQIRLDSFQVMML